MESKSIRSIVQQAADAWMTGNADGFAQLFAVDGVFIVPGYQWVGRNTIREVTADFSATHTDVKIEITQILTDGDRAVVEWSWSDTEKVTGKKQIAEDAIAIDFKDGLITRWREYIDSKTPSR